MTQATELRELASLLRVHDGKIGIGPLTANPPYTLSLGQTNVAGAHTIRLAGNGNPKHEIQFREAGTSYGFTFRYAGDAADNKLHIVQHENDANGTEVMTFKRDSMEVGIGTDSPDLLYEGLHIKSANPSLKIEGTGTNSWEFIHLKQPNHDRLIGMRTTGNIVINSGTNLDANNMLVIDTAGKVGVNVEYPDHDLDVNGAIATRQVRHSISPTLSLDFANSKQLDSRITFYRDSIATYYDSKGIIRYANVNEPRFDHDPATGESKGLLIEEARTNIFNYTNNPEKWSLMNAGSSSPIVNSVLSPDGTMNATKLIVTGGDPYFYQNGLTLNGTYTFSFWIKAFGSTVGKHYTVRGANIGTSFNIAPPGGLPSEWTRITHTFTSGSTSTAYIGVEAVDNSPANGDELSIWGAQLELGSFASSLMPSDDKFTSRSSEATYYDETGILRTAPANSPRYGYKYDGRKWVETGLILENAATNLLRSANDIGTYWSASNGTRTDAKMTAPDGSDTAWTYVASTTDMDVGLVHNTVNLSPTTVTFSAYVKAASSGEVGKSFKIRMKRSGGTLVTAEETFTLTNEWVKHSVTMTMNADNNGVMCYLGGIIGSVGAVWGAQLETGYTPSSFIYTNGNSGGVTRSADVVSSVAYTRAIDVAKINNINYSDWYNTEQGSIYVDFDPSDGSGSDAVVVGVGDGTSRGFRAPWLTGSAQIRAASWSGTAYSALQYYNSVTTTDQHKVGISFSYQDATFTSSLDGSTAQQATSWAGVETDATTMWIGGETDTNRPYSGTIAKVVIYNEALSGAELQALTENN